VATTAPTNPSPAKIIEAYPRIFIRGHFGQRTTRLQRQGRLGRRSPKGEGGRPKACLAIARFASDGGSAASRC
jgi:hypothetical protein